MQIKQAADYLGINPRSLHRNESVELLTPYGIATATGSSVQPV